MDAGGRPLDRGAPGAALPGLQTVWLSVRSKQSSMQDRRASWQIGQSYVGAQPSRLIHINASAEP
jgi:hypothetical protein